jgi:hypothetical protein
VDRLLLIGRHQRRGGRRLGRRIGHLDLPAQACPQSVPCHPVPPDRAERPARGPVGQAFFRTRTR